MNGRTIFTTGNETLLEIGELYDPMNLPNHITINNITYIIANVRDEFCSQKVMNGGSSHLICRTILLNSLR